MNLSCCKTKEREESDPDEKVKRPDPDEKAEKSELFRRAFNVACTNIFCITRPIGNDTPFVRHFMVGLYPLHFVVNMTTLVLERFFSDTNVIAIRGEIFNYNNVVLVAMLTGIANLILFILFYYPNFFSVAVKKIYDAVVSLSRSSPSSGASSVGVSSPEAGVERGAWPRPGRTWGDKEGTQEDKETLGGIVMARLQDPGNIGKYIWGLVLV